MKKFLTFALFAMLCGATITSCKDKDEIAPETEKPEPAGKEDLNVDLSMVSEPTACVGTVPDAIRKHFTNIEGGVSENTKVLIVNRENVSASQADIDKVEDAGGVIVFVEPDDHEFDVTGSCETLNSKYLLEDDELNINFGDGITSDHSKHEDHDGHELPSTNPDDLLPHIYSDEELAEAVHMFNPLAEWVNTQFIEMKARQTRAATRGDDDRTDITKNLEQQRISHTFYFKGETRLRCIWWEDYHVRGTGSVTNTYTIYKLYAFEGQEGSGDYYMVKCNSKIASNDMYKGRWKDIRIGIHIRQTGYFLKDVLFTHTPLDANNQPYSADVVMIPTDGAVSPTTTVNQTTYTSTKSFGINVGGKLKQSSGMDDGDPKSETSGEINVSFSWGWEDSEQQTLSDLDILEQSNGCVVGHTYKVRNTPKYQWSDLYGFTEGCNACKSTIQLNSSWVWYIKGTKDDTTDQILNIRSGYRCNYGAMSFTTTDVSLEEFNWSAHEEEVLQVTPPDRTTVGYVELENTFGDLSISDIEILDDKGNSVYQGKGTYSPKDKVKLALGKGKRSIQFKAGQNAASAKTYVLVAGPLTIEKGKTVNLKSAYDFKVKE